MALNVCLCHSIRKSLKRHFLGLIYIFFLSLICFQEHKAFLHSALSSLLASFLFFFFNVPQSSHLLDLGAGNTPNYLFVLDLILPRQTFYFYLHSCGIYVYSQQISKDLKTPLNHQVFRLKKRKYFLINCFQKEAIYA